MKLLRTASILLMYFMSYCTPEYFLTRDLNDLWLEELSRFQILEIGSITHQGNISIEIQDSNGTTFYYMFFFKAISKNRAIYRISSSTQKADIDMKSSTYAGLFIKNNMLYMGTETSDSPEDVIFSEKMQQEIGQYHKK